jgi:hypothetical protein
LRNTGPDAIRVSSLADAGDHLIQRDRREARVTAVAVIKAALTVKDAGGGQLGNPNIRHGAATLAAPRS